MKNLLLIILAFSLCFNASASFDGPKPKKAKSGYNYKAHQKRNATYKRNNERGKYMKCKRNH
jgi:hypothetical protein